MRYTRSIRRLAAGVLAVAAAAFATAASAQTAAAPVNRSAPTIEGKLFAGSAVSAGNGIWANNPTSFTYQWLRCNQQGTGCGNISGATSRTYTLAADDVGHTIVVLVTAANSDGKTGPVNSKPSAVVSAAAAPTSSSPPAITGKALAGEVLVASPGKYSGGIPSGFAYQWQRCDKTGAACAGIGGATSQTYTVRNSDTGHTLRVQVKASNPYGSVATTSDKTAVVGTAPAKVTVTTSFTSSVSAVTCCAAAKLSGTVSTNKPGEQITILAQAFGDLATVPIGTTTTDASGNWTFSVRPSIQTIYTAKTSTSATSPITVNVHPRVGLGYQNRIFSTKVTGGTGATSFAGKVVFFQRQSAGGRWVTLDRVVLNLSSVAKFKVKLPHGLSLVRVYLTQTQAGAGYLDGVSHTRRFTSR